MPKSNIRLPLPDTVPQNRNIAVKLKFGWIVLYGTLETKGTYVKWLLKSI